jgi:DNA-directed RNA polymerase specialized sigma24 family protein
MSFKECSRILGEPVGTLLSRKSRALKKMENILHQIGFSKEDYYEE